MNNTAARLIEETKRRRTALHLGVEYDRDTTELTHRIGRFTAWLSTPEQRDSVIAKAFAEGLWPASIIAVRPA